MSALESWHNQNCGEQAGAYFVFPLGIICLSPFPNHRLAAEEALYLAATLVTATMAPDPGCGKPKGRYPIGAQGAMEFSYCLCQQGQPPDCKNVYESQ